MSALQIWIPKDAEPTFRCLICKAQYAQDQRHTFEHHVARCATEHAAEIHELRPSVKNPVLQGGIWDKELGRWIEDNRDALLEDRKKI